MKKILAILLVLIMLLAVTACKKEVNDSDAPSSSVPASSEPVSSEPEAEFTKPEGYVTVLLVTINPQFKLYLDAESKVLAAEPVNDDAKSFAKDISLEDASLETVIKEIITVSNEKGFVKEDATVKFEIVEKTADKTNETEILEAAKTTAEQTAEEEEITVKVEYTAQEPATPTYTPLSSKSGGWTCRYVCQAEVGELLLDATLIIKAPAGTDFEDLTLYVGGSRLPEPEEPFDPAEAIEFNGKLYLPAMGSGGAPLGTVSEDGTTVVITSPEGTKLTLMRTGENTMKVTESPDDFTDLRKIAVGTVLTFSSEIE